MSQFQDFHDFARGRLHGFTGREWLVDRVRAWRADENASRILIIVGGPGVGKSAFGAHLWLEKGMVDAAHFCIAGQGGTVEPLAFVRSLGEQLAARVPGFGQALADSEAEYSDQRITVTAAVSASVVHDGAEVTGIRIVNLHLGALPPEQAFERMVRRPLRRLERAGKLLPLTLMVDALDEAATYGGGAGILDLLARTDDLPRQVRFLLTSRAEPQVETWFCGVPHEIIDAQSEQNRDDVRRYLAGQFAKRPELQEAAARQGWDQVQFTETIGAAAEWSFLYLILALDEIVSGKLLRRPRDVLPAGLDGFYTYLLNSRIGLNTWHDWGADLLEVVLASAEPASLEQIADLLAWPTRQTGQRLQKVAQLLDASLFEQGLYWRTHWSVAQFLADKNRAGAYWLDVDGGNRLIATYYLADPTRWSRHRSYVFRHLSSHLAAADMFAELGGLVERRDWYEAQRDHDPSLHTYAADVDRALDLAEHRGLNGLPQAVAWSLLYSSVRTRATQIPVAALETMAMLGQSERALLYAALITDPAQRSNAYLRLAQQFHIQGQQAWTRQTLSAALVAAEGIGDEYRCVEALMGVAQDLAQVGEKGQARSVLQRALAIAEGIGGKVYRAMALTDVAQNLAQIGEKSRARNVLQRAFAAAESLREDWQRALVLCGMARAVMCTGTRAMLQRVLVAAERISDESPRAEVLEAVARALAQAGNFERALVVAEGIRDEARRAMMLSGVAEALAQAGETEQAIALLQRTLATATSIEYEGARAQALRSIAQAVVLAGDREGLQQVLTAAEGIEKASPWGAQALNDIAQTLACMGDFEHALAVSKCIGVIEYRAAALRGVAEALTRVGDMVEARAVLHQALAAALKIGEEEDRVSATRFVAEAMAQAGDFKGALAAVTKIGNKHLRADEALCGVAKVLIQQGHFEHALTAAETIGHRRWRADALSGVAQAMAWAGETAKARGVLQQALEAAEGSGDRHPRSHTLGCIAQALAEAGDSDRALAAAERIDDNEYARAEALHGVAQAMVQAGSLEHAVAVSESISVGEYRAKVLSSVAQGLACAGDFETAVALAEGISSKYEHAQALICSKTIRITH
jgi:tetratricopeptide (TPR) repeat protein